MIHIFEGVDHAGKDTVIDVFKKYFRDIPVFDGFNVYDSSLTKDIKRHLKSPEEWQKAIAYETINFCRQTNVDVIINRFTWSELVYGDMFRGGADWSFYFDVMEEELKDIAEIFYITADTDDIKERINISDRKKSRKIINNIDNLKRSYEALIEKTELKVTIIDTSSEEYKELIRKWEAAS